MQHRAPLIFLAVLLAALVPLLFLMASPFVTSFILASLIAVVMHPVKEWLSRRLRRPWLATFVTTFVTVSLLGILLAFAGFTLTRELTSAYNELSQRSLQQGGWPAMVAGTADRVASALATRLPIDKEAIRVELIDRMKAASGYLLSKAGAAVGGATSALVTMLLVTLFLYVLLRYGEDWAVRLAALTPLDARTSASLLRTAHDAVVGNVIGMFASAVGNGLLLILLFWLFGVRSPLLWGALGGLASVVPAVGAALVWAPVAIAFLLAGAYVKALTLSLACLLLLGSVENVLRPFLVGTRAKQHPMLIALAAIGGAYAFGAVGILLGPLVVSLAAALLKEIQRLTSHTALAGDGAPPPA